MAALEKRVGKQHELIYLQTTLHETNQPPSNYFFVAGFGKRGQDAWLDEEGVGTHPALTSSRNCLGPQVQVNASCSGHCL